MARLRRSRAAVSGFLNIHKPAGVTSHHCVSVVRKIFNTTEVGHAGTLDPMATGVLVMAIGRATKFLQVRSHKTARSWVKAARLTSAKMRRIAKYLTSDKEYRGVVRFGVTTDTDDITGEVLTEQAVPWVTEPLVRSHLDRFVGPIDQIPPRISALKRDGERLYNLARANKVFDVAPRRVEIHGIDLLEFIAGNFPEATLRVSCGAGTYIRSIARECGEAMEIPRDLIPAESSAPLMNPRGQPCVGGTLVSLERTRSGVFTANHSVSFEQVRGHLEAGHDPVQPIESAVQHLPLVSLIPPRVTHWFMGGEVAIHPDVVRVALDSPELSPLIPNIHVRVYDQRHRFLGISQVDATPSRGGFILRRRNFAVDPPQPVVAKEEVS